MCAPQIAYGSGILHRAQHRLPQWSLFRPTNQHNLHSVFDQRVSQGRKPCGRPLACRRELTCARVHGDERSVAINVIGEQQRGGTLIRSVHLECWRGRAMSTQERNDCQPVCGLMVFAKAGIEHAVGQKETSPVVATVPPLRSRGKRERGVFERAEPGGEMMQDQTGIKRLLPELAPKARGIDQIVGPQQLLRPVEALLLKDDDLVVKRLIAQSGYANGCG